MSSKPVNGPELWDKILAAAPEGAVIAGGAVRDYILNLPVKDIDVFVPKTWPSEGQAQPGAMLQTKDQDFVPQPPLENRKEEYEGKTFVAFVTDYQLFHVPVQVIDTFVEPGEDFGQRLVGTFDFGITRYWYDGRINCTPEAAEDAVRDLVVDRLGDRPERAAIRAARFIARNPGFTYVPFTPEFA